MINIRQKIYIAIDRLDYFIDEYCIHLKAENQIYIDKYSRQIKCQVVYIRDLFNIYHREHPRYIMDNIEESKKFKEMKSRIKRLGL